ncbi:uncharacterized protein BN812_00459 [Prevotella sp. CAG:924]|nr:uncharacterized protein BN812_00459 [Prevotella sp. CAG:924]
MDILRIVGIIHDCHLNGHALLLCLQIDDIIEQMGTVTINITHEFFQTVLCMEDFRTCLSSLGIRAQIGECDFHTGIQISQLTHTTCHDVPLISRSRKDRAIRPELLTGTTFLGRANHLHRIERATLLIFLLIDLAITEHLRHHVCRERIHTAHTHTVQTTADLVGAFIKLTSGMEHRHHHFKGRLVQLRMLIYRDTATIILHRHRTVHIECHLNVVAITGHGLIDRVVHRLIDKMVQAFLANIAYIHSRALTHGLQALEHLNIRG